MKGDTDIFDLRNKYREQIHSKFNVQNKFNSVKAISYSKKIHPRGGVYKRIFKLYL